MMHWNELKFEKLLKKMYTMNQSLGIKKDNIEVVVKMCLESGMLLMWYKINDYLYTIILKEKFYIIKTLHWI